MSSVTGKACQSKLINAKLLKGISKGYYGNKELIGFSSTVEAITFVLRYVDSKPNSVREGFFHESLNYLSIPSQETRKAVLKLNSHAVYSSCCTLCQVH